VGGDVIAVLPTRQARAIVYAIEADLIDTSTPGNRSWLPGRGTITARVDVDGTDYEWSVSNPRDYAIGDYVMVTVPA
jgi:hypothetical protein